MEAPGINPYLPTKFRPASRIECAPEKIKMIADNDLPAPLPEPWLRGTLADIPPVQRAVLHALQLAKEDIYRWCAELTQEELHARPAGLDPISFHLRHISRSLDRLLTYAEGSKLSEKQIEALNKEKETGASRNQLFGEFEAAIEASAARIRAFGPAQLLESRTVGKKALPTTVTGLLVHIAEHTQRHVGQAIATSKVVRGNK
jgi:uncharacterized damage-inducible protein DinB